MKKNKMKWCVVILVVVCGVGALVAFRQTQSDKITVFQTSERQKDADGAKGTAASLEGLVPGGAVAEGQDGRETAEQEKQPDGETMIYVHVCGAVVNEGVYALSGGSRAVDAVAAAGGFLPEADRAYYNLARQLADGQRIYIPTKEETCEMTVSERTEDGFEETSGGTKEKRVDLNTAGKDELMTLPGIGEAKAESILNYRKKVGGFHTAEEIKNVSGIGDALYEQVKELIFVK